MSDAVIFGIGGIVFILVTWAAIAFLMTSVMALEKDDPGAESPGR